MPEFTANISGPGSVSSGYSAHESGASMIGEALGGFAKVLDVGLKASAQDRSERLTKEVGDRLQGVVRPNDNPAPLTVGGTDVFNDGSLQQWEKAQGLDKIGRLAQANRHSPDKVSTGQMMGQAAAITQQIIHDHPRYANEIRAKVQQILGVNPTEEMLKINLDDEKTLKAQQMAIKTRGAEEAMAVGVPAMFDQNGNFDTDAMYSAGAKIKVADHQIEMMNKQLEGQRLELEIKKLQGGPPETAQQRTARVQQAFRQPLDSVFNTIMDANVNGFVQGLINPGRGIPMPGATNSMNGQPMVPNEQQMREGAIVGLAKAQASFARTVQKYRTQLTAGGTSEITEAEMKDVVESYDRQFAELKNLLVSAPKEVIEARMDTLKDMQTRTKIDFFTSNPAVAKLTTVFGEQVIAGAVQVAIDSLPAAKTGLGSAVIQILNNVSAIGKGETNVIPDKATAQTLVAANQKLGENADKLTPDQRTTYGNVSNSLIDAGLKYADVDQLAGAVQATSSPGLLKAFDAYRKDPAHAQEAEQLGQKLVTLNSHFIQNATNKLQPYTGGSTLTYTPVYNPNAGRMEITVTDAIGRQVNPNLTYTPGYVDNGTPAAMVARVNQINQSLAAVTHLKEFSAEGNFDDQQVKQTMMLGVPLKAGTTRVLMPGEKEVDGVITKGGKPVPKPAKTATAAPTGDDPLGLFQ